MAGDSENQKDHLDSFERSQAALRESIEETKRLAEQSQSLLDQHRKQERD